MSMSSSVRRVLTMTMTPGGVGGGRTMWVGSNLCKRGLSRMGGIPIPIPLLTKLREEVEAGSFAMAFNNTDKRWYHQCRRNLKSPLGLVLFSSAKRNCSHDHSQPQAAATTEDPTQSALTVEGVDVIYFRGLPQFTIPLPSRRERCRFIVKPLTNTVGDLLDMIRSEDKGVDRVGFFSSDGIRIAASNTIEMLMEYDFDMIINDNIYSVKTPSQEKPSQEDLNRLSSVRNLVGQLYGALNVDEHQLRHEREMTMELERLKGELVPLEGKREQINELAMKRTNTLTWVGLGLMSVQFGILARLTWWEYSWDIMEPVTYFVTYGTAMLCYAYFVLTKQEYVLPQVTDRQYLNTFHKNAKKVGLDLAKYNLLREKIHKIETDLARLRDPLALHLPLKTRMEGDQESSSGAILKAIRGDAAPSSQSIVSQATRRIQEMFKKGGGSSSSS